MLLVVAGRIAKAVSEAAGDTVQKEIKTKREDKTLIVFIKYT